MLKLWQLLIDSRQQPWFLLFMVVMYNISKCFIWWVFDSYAEEEKMLFDVEQLESEKEKEEEN